VLSLNITVSVFTPSSSDCVREDIVFSVRPSAAFVRSFFVRPDKSCYERLEQSQWNLQKIFISPYWWPD